jgi:hypothetical protein
MPADRHPRIAIAPRAEWCHRAGRVCRMNPIGRVLLLLLLVLAGTRMPATTAREEAVTLPGNRKVHVTLPDGFEMSAGRDQGGPMLVRIVDREARINLQMTFLPDVQGLMANARARKEFMFETLQHYVEQSVEKAMQFEELEPEVGAGTYCVFTDITLVGRSTLPEGEYLNATAGVKAWPGLAVVFTLLSNGTDSKPYQDAMAMLRRSVHERAVPLR